MPAKRSHIGVLIVSSQSLVKRRIVDALSSHDEIKVEGLASTIAQLQKLITELKPSIVIVNDDDKGINFMEAVALINKKASDAKILMLVKDYHDEKELSALRMGVRGFLPRGVAKTDFVRCVKAIYTGEMWVRRRVMEKLIDQLLKRTSRINQANLGTISERIDR